MVMQVTKRVQRGIILSEQEEENEYAAGSDLWKTGK
jgi:hypothetical protein